MKKYAVAAAISIAVFGTFDVHAEGDGAFVQAGAGHSNLRNADTAWQVSGGYRWGLARSFYLGAEAGYVDLGKSKFHDSGTLSADINGIHPIAYDTRGHGELNAVTLGLNARWDVADNIYLLAHGGIARYRSHTRVNGVSTPQGGSPDSYSDSYTIHDTNWYGGAGMGFNITPQFSLQVMYDHYPQRYTIYGLHIKESTDMWSTSLEYRF